MKKKVSFWMYASAGVILAVVGIWGFCSEYGSGYSEDQRRNWNEFVARTESDAFAYMNLSLNSESGSAMKERSSRPDAPSWGIDFSGVSEELPLEGLSTVALTHLADNGNGDACLELVFRHGEETQGFSSLNVVFQGEKYLNKAVAAGRPGADFLLRLFMERKKYGNDVTKENVVGYRDFLSHLDEGDFLLGKVYLYLNPKDESGLDRLAIGLAEKASQGDVVALRNSGHLKVLRTADNGDGRLWARIFFEQSTQEGVSWWLDCISKAEEVLPDAIRPESSGIEEKARLFFSSWYMKKARKRLKPHLDLLMVAAERGDIHAKFLWTQYSVWGGMKFSKKDWETHLRYTDELLKAGGRYTGKHPLYFNVSLGSLSPIESFFYNQENQKTMAVLMKQKKQRECEAIFSNASNAAGETFNLTMEVEARCKMSSFVFNYILDVLGTKKGQPKEWMRGLQLMEEAAEEGNPAALLGLARMLNEGIVVTQDAGKAWELLRRLQTWREGIHQAKNPFIGDVQWFEKSDHMRISYPVSVDMALEYQRMDIVSRHGNMPGMTVKEAFDRFLEGSRSMNSYVRARLDEQFEKRGYKTSDAGVK